MSQLINSSVYEKGITATLEDVFAVVLLSDEDSILATSACIDNKEVPSPENINFLNDKINWTRLSKTITISSFKFEETKSVVPADSVQVATKYALIKLDKNDYDLGKEPEPSYEGGMDKYVWPNFSSTSSIPKEENIILEGMLSVPSNIEANNNFNFKATEIKFSEEQII